jgi:class 3 adenylate cyclase
MTTTDILSPSLSLSVVTNQSSHSLQNTTLEWECLGTEAEAILPKNQLFAARMLRTAVEFVNISRTTFHPRTSEPINIRVGMHSGTVVGGVIGTRAFRFDVWGPDVLRANKYESGGISGGINISAETYDLLQSLQKHSRFFIPGLSFRSHVSDDVPSFIVSIDNVRLSQGVDEG